MKTFKWTFVAALAVAGSVAFADWSYEGQWWQPSGSNAKDVAVAANGNVYLPGFIYVYYYTPTGSFLGSWNVPTLRSGIDIAPNGNVYVAGDGYTRAISYYTPSGSLLGSWGTEGSGNGQFEAARGIAIASDGTVYVSDFDLHRVQYFTATGSYLGRWGKRGMSNGDFYSPTAVAVSPRGRVYVADHHNQRVQYFNRTGCF